MKLNYKDMNEICKYNSHGYCTIKHKNVRTPKAIFENCDECEKFEILT